MARKKKPPAQGASKAYLVSFGDTMTALLAFFIVLNSLATEQTGANLHSGTGSFMSAIKSAGLQGILSQKRSELVTQLSTTAPQYQVPPYDEQDPERHATGPDEVDSKRRSIEREREEFEVFMRDIDKSFAVAALPTAQGEVAFDVFERVANKPPYLPDAAEKLLPQVLPLLSNERYRVKVVVWATTPSVTAWTRATKQASALVKELAGRLPADQHSRLQGIGQPWGSSQDKRPTMSFLVRRLP